MADFFTVSNLLTLAILTILETVLGFDNLLYIMLEAKRVRPERQKYVRRVGLLLALILRIVLLFVVLKLIEVFQETFATMDFGFVSGAFNGHSIIVLVGGIFLIYTAVKEIIHMLSQHNLSEGEGGSRLRTVPVALFWMLAMNIVFSFDTVLSAVALTSNFATMALAVVLSGALMIGLSEHVARFLARNRMYEVLGLFVLLLVGVMLASEGAHIAHLHFFGHAILPLEKSTFYFILGILVMVDVIQGRYQRKLDAASDTETASH